LVVQQIDLPSIIPEGWRRGLSLINGANGMVLQRDERD
jgi:hypothetical protein